MKVNIEIEQTNEIYNVKVTIDGISYFELNGVDRRHAWRAIREMLVLPDDKD